MSRRSPAPLLATLAMLGVAAQGAASSPAPRTLLVPGPDADGMALARWTRG